MPILISTRPAALPSVHPTLQLDRPSPSALPRSFFWTWDHSCSWVLDDPGLQTSGCYNAYLKSPETFVEDYRRLTDMASGLGIHGIAIWGFLRDAHGGVEAGKRVAAYGASRGVAILPGFGSTWYGGAYYEGDHPYSLQHFLRLHPDARMLEPDGTPKEFSGEFGACAAHPAFQSWLQEAIDWLFSEFEIGGLNIENGDFLVDHHPLFKAMRQSWPAEDPEVFAHQGISYRRVLEAVGPRRLEQYHCAYATYAGFHHLDTDTPHQDTGLGRRVPAMFNVLPPTAPAQWTLSGMLLPKPLPLTAYLDDGAPVAAFENPTWPVGLRPPSRRSVGFLHQGSQWRGQRHTCTVSTIKEACLRAHRSGLEGVAIHGEVTSRVIPMALNYLAFSHFTHWPEDTLRDFGRKTLAQIVGTQRDAEDYTQVLAHWDAGTITDDHVKLADPTAHGFTPRRAGSAADTPAELQRYHFWAWLQWAARLRLTREQTGTLSV